MPLFKNSYGGGVGLDWGAFAFAGTLGRVGMVGG